MLQLLYFFLRRLMMIKKYFFLVIILISTNLKALETLTHHREHANSVNELPTPDNDNLLNPDYSQFHRDNSPSILDSIKSFLGLQSQGFFDIDMFEKFLVHVTNTRKKQNITGQIAARLTLTQSSKIYIWGDLHGAYHSLIRALESLQQTKVINENLKIIKPDHFFVFNGDAINRSPFSLETLSIILALLKQNPNHVFYIRGNHETKSHWLDYGLKRELQIRVRKSPETIVAFQQEIEDFFNTLPLALYIHNKGNLNTFIRISHFGREKENISEQKLSSFLMQKTTKNGVAYCDITKCIEGKTAPHIPIIIKTEKWRNEHQAINGLGLQEQDKGSVSWTVFSSPILPYQKFYDFYYDAFAVIETNQINILQSTISLYNRDSRTKKSI